MNKKYELPEEDEIKEKLTDIQYKVTRKDGTEPPFNNKYWNNYKEGIYVDVITGEPLFSSKDKFKSGCGWPSFSNPIDETAIVEKIDTKYGMIRTEIRTKNSNSHLGHVFDDGPEESGGLRYCINSASLEFIPKEKMEEKGYGDLLFIFEK